MSFASKIIAWYEENGRDLPWRQTKNPYVIWLSEIILQQTRVEQGMPYFYRFVENFPSIKEFADAEEEEILRLWQGLGYYSRARNMHKAAKDVVSRFNGIFPSRYADVITLSGIGEYTASAISSFAIDEPRAVVDGNVYRVLSRVFGIEEPINSTKGKKMFQDLADDLLDQEYPGLYNQAMMDFGAIQCKPKQPLCATCILRLECVAYAAGTVHLLPVKLKGKKSRNRYFHYFLITQEDKILLSKRPEGDVWTKLYEFPLIETEQSTSVNELINTPDFVTYFGSAKPEMIGDEIKHVLSHQNIYARFYQFTEELSPLDKKSHWDYFLLEKIDKLAKHKLICTFLEKNHLIDKP